MYLSATSSLQYDYTVKSSDPSGLTVYETEVTFGSEYAFIPSNDVGDFHVFLLATIDGEQKRLETSGVWNYDTDSGEVQLLTTYGYRIEYVLNKQEYRFESTTEYVFNGEDFDFGVPVAIDEDNFLGWYILNENDEEILLTDALGKGTRWSFTESSVYTVYAKWENNV